MVTDKQIAKGKEVIIKYLLPDCLKPQYDGKMLYEIVKEMLQAVQDQDNEEMVNDLFEQEERHDPLNKTAEQVDFSDIKI